MSAWARATEADATPLLACLEALQCKASEEIAAEVLDDIRQTQEAERAERDGGVHLDETVIAGGEAPRPLHDIEGEYSNASSVVAWVMTFGAMET